MRRRVDAVNSFAGALGGAALAAQVKQATGLDLEQDVFSWIGDVGGFVRGDDARPTLDGALVIESTDDAAGRGGVRQARSG